MTRDEELTALRAKLAMSKRMGGGFADRIKEIEKRIAEVEAREDNA